jgi:SNF2 family DNA or RNA helicase
MRDLLSVAVLCCAALSCSADRTFLRKWKWSQMVMDEAHALKNANSQRSRRLRKLATGGFC